MSKSEEMSIDIFEKMSTDSLIKITRFGPNSIKHQGISLRVYNVLFDWSYINVIAHVPRKYLRFLRKSVNICVGFVYNDNKHWCYFLYKGFEDFKPLVEDAHNLLLEKSIKQYKKYRANKLVNEQKYREKQKNLVKRFFNS